MSWYELFAALVSFLGIVLTARKMILCWPVNLLACALYFKLFLDVRLYADMVLQAVFGLTILYGWWAWRQSRLENAQMADGALVLQVLTPRAAGLGLGLGAVGSLAIGYGTSHYTDAAMPWLDATLSSYSVVAQVWAGRRYAAHWLLWMLVDVLYVGLFAAKGLWPTAVLYGLMVGLAVLGYRQWRKAEVNRPI